MIGAGQYEAGVTEREGGAGGGRAPPTARSAHSALAVAFPGAGEVRARVQVCLVRMQGDAGEHEVVRGFACCHGVEGSSRRAREGRGRTALVRARSRAGLRGRPGRVDQFLAPLAGSSGQQWADRKVDLVELRCYRVAAGQDALDWYERAGDGCDLIETVKMPGPTASSDRFRPIGRVSGSERRASREISPVGDIKFR